MFEAQNAFENSVLMPHHWPQQTTHVLNKTVKSTLFSFKDWNPDCEYIVNSRFLEDCDSECLWPSPNI